MTRARTRPGTPLAQLPSMIWMMANGQIASRTAGTFLGPFWLFAQPLATLAVYWYVFEFGLRVARTGDLPFVLYFMSGYIPWLLFNEAVGGGANAVVDNAYLVKKTQFPTQVLPIVNIVAAAIPHAILMLVLLVATPIMKGSLDWNALGLLYYFACLCVFALGLGWIISSLQVFNRDVGQLLIVAMNLWFWLTPIVWPVSLLSEQARVILDINPMFYIVDGYRQALFGTTPFWADWLGAARFWAVTLPLLIIGALMFRRLKADFADVL